MRGGRSYRLMITVFAVIGYCSSLLPTPAEAWAGHAHSLMMIQAVSVLPQGLRTKMEIFATELDDGVLKPDSVRAYDHKIRGAPTALKHFAEQAEEMIKAGKPFTEIALTVAQAAHFSEDVHVPLHLTYDESRAEHEAYERVAYFTDWPGNSKKYGYSGFKLVNDYKCFAHEAADRSWKYIQLARFPDPPRHIVEETWDGAVNDTVNLWLSIFYKALGPEKALELYGIPAPLSTVGNGTMCKW